MEPAGAVGVEGPEEAGVTVEEAEGLAEAEERLLVDQVPQPAIRGDRHA